MPIFDNELINNVSNRGAAPETPYLGSPDTLEVNLNLNPVEGSMSTQTDTLSRQGMSIDEMSNTNTPQKAPTFNSPMEVIPRSELLANQKYPIYQRGVDLENIYGLQQSWTSKLGNGVVKMAATGIGTFAQSFATIPNTISAIQNGKFSELSGDPDGFEGSIDNWLKNIENKFPNYYTRYEKLHPFKSAVPFTEGSANFWGDMVIKNLGFTIGAIGGALAQDAIIGALTSGIGTPATISSQVGKASLYLNKLFTGTNDVEKALEVGANLAKGTQQLLTVQRLGEMAAVVKVGSALRWGLNIYGSARTEAGVEARDGYRQIKENLVQQYQLEHPGEDMTPEELQEIENYATDGMNTRFGINMALLTVSNAIQFDNLFRAFNKVSPKTITGTLSKKIADAGKIGLVKDSIDTFEKKVATTVGGKLWDTVKPALPTMFSEGVYEEGGQYAAERGTYNYYTRKYKDLKDPNNRTNWDSVNETVNSTLTGLADQFGTTEGIQNMFIGAITAMITGAGMSVIDRMAGKSPSKRLDATVNMLNQHGLTGTLGDKYTDTLTTVGITKDMEDAVKTGDIYKYKNLKQDLFFSYVTSRIPSGMHDITIDQLNMLKDLKKEDFEQTFGMDFNQSSKKSVDSYVDSLINEANNIKKTVDSLNATFINPFNYDVKAESGSLAWIENQKYNTFNSWKTDLAYYASVAPNNKSRIESIGQELIKVDPLLNTEILSKVMNAESLKDLIKDYEEQAKQLDEAIALTTIYKDKKVLIKKSEAFRSMAQRIGLALEKDHDVESFTKILNFELNNQDATQPPVISTDKALDLMIYGKDINRLNYQRETASDIYDKLSNSEGLDKYFEQALKMAQEVPEEEAEVVPIKHVFKNRAGEDEELSLDREYEAEKPKEVKPVKSGQQWKVTNPITGVALVYPTKEDAQDAANDINEKATAASKVKIIKLNPDGTVKVEDQDGIIRDISLDKLKGFAKIQTEQEKLMKDKESIDNELKNLNIASGGINAGDPTNESTGEEGLRKDVWIFHKSGITESEQYEDPTKSQPHVTRSRVFLNNAKKFKNRNNMGVILVTPNNEEALGLKGLTQLSYKATDAEAATAEFKAIVRNLEKGFIAQVFVITEKDSEGKSKDYFVNINGDKLTDTPIGPRTDSILDRVIFQTMPSTSLITSKGGNRARTGQEAQFEENAKAWAAKRVDIFNYNDQYKIEKFVISRGIPKQNITLVAGKTIYEKNHVGGILVDEDNIATNVILIAISSEGKVNHQGQNIPFSDGRPVLQDGDTLQFLNNNKFSSNQALAIFEVIQKFTNDIISQSKAGTKIKFNTEYTNFLKNVLFFSTVAKNDSNNQFFVNTSDMTISIGKKPFALTKLAENKDAILDLIGKAYHNVNGKTLKDEFNNSFKEYYVENGILKSDRIWFNYQIYLLSSKNPDGTVRNIDNTPLTTSVAKPTTLVPYSFEQKYATMVDFDIPVKVVKKDVKSTTVRIGNYILDNSVNNYPLANNKSLDFKGTVENGKIEVEIIDNDKLKELIDTPATVRIAITTLDKEGEDVSGASDMTKPQVERDVIIKKLVKQFMKNYIEANLIILQKEKAAKPEEKVKQPEQKVESTIDLALVETFINSLGTVISTRGVKALLATMKDGTVTEVNVKKELKITSNIAEITKKINAYLATFSQPEVKEEVKEEVKQKISEKPIVSTEVALLKVLKDFVDDEYTPTQINQLLASVMPNGKVDPEEIITILPDVEGLSTAKYLSEEIFKALPHLTPTKTSKITGKVTRDKDSKPDSEFRKVGTLEAGKQRLTDKELELFKQWMAAYLPNMPYQVLDNIINTVDDEEAWGVFENGVIKFYKKSIRGTEYHEVGEGIWKAFLTPEERQALIDEFRNSAGSFVDRQSGKTYKKDDPQVSDFMIKERIMDDFAEFQLGKLPARSLGERVLRFFRAIIDFFKTFGKDPSLKTSLFEAINTGEFKNRVISEKTKLETAEYSKVENMSDTAVAQYVQDMTIRAIQAIFGSNNKKALFDPEKVTGQQIYDVIKEQYIDDEIYYEELTPARFKQIFLRTKDIIRTLGINLNEENFTDINDGGTENRSYAPEPFSTDWKTYSPYAIRIVSATLPQAEALNQEGDKPMNLPKLLRSSIADGYLINNFSKVFATLLDRFSNTSSVKRVTQKLEALARKDSNYIRLFTRLGGDLKSGTIPFQDFKAEDWRLFVNFYQTFTKQHPEALIQFVSDGDVYTARADQFRASKQIQQRWFEMMKSIAAEPTSILTRVKAVYKVKKLDAKINPLANGTFDVVDYAGDVFNYKTEKEAKAAAIRLSFPVKTANEMIDFLNAIGIGLTLQDYFRMNADQKKSFEIATSRIREYIQKVPEIGSIKGKILGINGPLNILANIWVNINDPHQENTHINVDGTVSQNYAENNVASVFANDFNESGSRDKLIESKPELNDVFSRNSIVLKKGGLFFNEKGVQIKDLNISYIQGRKIVDKNKGTSIAKVGLGDRISMEINQNLNGNYYVLVPADTSTEWMINLGNSILFSQIQNKKASKSIHSTFRGYLTDEIALALDYDNRESLKAVGDKAKQLRFFKDILGNYSPKTLEGINALIHDNSTQVKIEAYVDEHIKDINSAVDQFINDTVSETKELLIKTGQITFDNKSDTYSYKNLETTNFQGLDNKINKLKLSQEELNQILMFVNTNYIINNIELHKIMFGDPYQFDVIDGRLDETKRIKSFLSPRRTTFNTDEFNTFLNQEYNTVDGIHLQASDYNTPGELGYHLHKNYATTVTVADIKLKHEFYQKAYDETDGFSIIMDNTYREVKTKNGQWTTKAEIWHQWQMAYTRQNIPGYKYISEALKAHDIQLLKRPEPNYVTEVMKPIVSGVKANETQINLVLDKMSQMPVYFKMVQGTNLEKLYTKMWKESIDYVVFASARKVGAENVHSLYKNGQFNEEEFADDTIIQVPWKAYGIQVENSYEHSHEQTRGSQITKIASLDFFNNGVASSPEAQAEYDRNVDFLNKIHEHAYQRLLKKLGIIDEGKGQFRLEDPKAISESLEYEMLRRKVSENVKDTIRLDKNDQFAMPFEASPAYRQIRDILYSMINKNLISLKTSGGPKVQVPVTLWENAKEGRGLVKKTKTGYEKVTREVYEAMSAADKKNVRLTSDTLKFYTREDRYCEVLLPHWFKDSFNKKRFPTDESILNYLNTPEGQKILTGIGFRIPTQSMSSIEVFRVKGFLDKSMGDTIVVPSEIVAKAGSDFDIDKMNTYLKSVYVDERGDVKLVEYQGSEEETKKFFSDVFSRTILFDIKKIMKYDEFRGTLLDIFKLLESSETINIEDNIDLLEDEDYDFYENHERMINEIINQANEQDLKPSEYITAQINRLLGKRKELTEELLDAALREEFVESMYRKSLENGYYDSLEKLITLPENFDRLMAPVDDAGLKQDAADLDTWRNQSESGIKNRLLNRNYMTSLRNSFVMAKKWIGIAAVNITGQSLTQKFRAFIDPERFKALDESDRVVLGDGKVLLPHNTINGYISMSGTKTQDGRDQYISDRLSGYATAFVDVAKDPYIMKIISSDLALGTFMFLERIGCGKNTVLFMNQPVILNYLAHLDSKGSRFLFNSSVQDDFLKLNYPTSKKALENATVAINSLQSNIEKFAAKGFVANDIENAEQRVILTEFLKYAKMAEFSFEMTQATNYDTTRFTNSDSFSRKKTKTEIAKEINIFSDVENMMKYSHIGKQKELLDYAMSSMGAILKLEENRFKEITKKVMRTYEHMKYISADSFDKIASKVKASFLDYIIQMDPTLNLRDKIYELTVGPNSIANQIEAAKLKYPDVQILQDFETRTSERADGAKGVQLKVNLKEAYDEDMYTDFMRELRDIDPVLYNNLVDYALLQGTYQTSMSFKNIIPLEDYAAKVKPIIDRLNISDELEAFANGVFQRANWKDDDIVPIFVPKYFEEHSDEDDYGNLLTNYFTYNLPKIPKIPKGISEAEKQQRKEENHKLSRDRRIILINPKYNFLESKHDFIKIPRKIAISDDNYIDFLDNWTITGYEFGQMKAKGDLSIKEYYGYQKLRDLQGNPVVDAEGSFIYKQVNLLGDGNLTTEFYPDDRASVIDNGTAKVGQTGDAIDKAVIANVNSKLTYELDIERKISETYEDNKEVQDKLNKLLDWAKESKKANALLPIDFLDDSVKLPIIASFKERYDALQKDTYVSFAVEYKKIHLYAKKAEIVDAWDVYNNQLKTKFNNDVYVAFKNAIINNTTSVAKPEPVATPTPQQSGQREYTPENITSLKSNEVFVFGSNEGTSKGGPQTHGKGAALLAKQKFGAIQGQARGLQGQSYAVVTKKHWDVEKSSTLQEILAELEEMNQFAYKHPDKKLLVTKLGSSLAGYSISEIKNLFKELNEYEGIADNIILPKEYEVRDEVPIQKKEEIPSEPVETGIAGDAVYRYYGREYFIHTLDGKAIDVEGYKGKNVDKQKLMDAFNKDPNIDPQNNKPFQQLPDLGQDMKDLYNRSEYKSDEEESIDDRAEKDNPETNHQGTFSYKGKTIKTQFTLTGSQEKAMEALSDFATTQDERVITLQGAAGTGKTSVIGYLQNYLGGRYNFVYLAPTHAAVAELGFATIKTGSRSLPFTVQSSITEKYDPIKQSYTTIATKKFKDRLGLSNNVIVIDESSMLSGKDYDRIKKVAESMDLKIIFMGDIMQIPEVNISNPEKKLVSKAFTDNKQVTLTEVKRTSNDTMLKALGYIRENPNGKIPVVEGSDDIQYLNEMEFNRALAKKIQEEPEDTMLISYTNASVKAVNNKIKKALGFEGDPKEGLAIVGYGGYNTKQIENQNIANSIRYIITSVTKNGSQYNIVAKSKKLGMLKKAGVNVSEKATSRYLQLSNSDALTFQELTQADFDENNATISRMMVDLLAAKKYAISSKTGAAWAQFYNKLESVGAYFMETNLGGDYIFNPETGSMESLNLQDKTSGHAEIKKDFPEMVVEKGIDYGYAVTIHKSQGTTIKNVFFDASTLPRYDSSKLYSNGKQISTEKHALLYVGMSRASGSLFINKENPEHFYIPGQEKSVSLQGQDTIKGFYNSLTAEQLSKLEALGLGTLEKLNQDFESVPIHDYTQSEFIEDLKCKL